MKLGTIALCLITVMRNVVVRWAVKNACFPQPNVFLDSYLALIFATKR